MIKKAATLGKNQFHFKKKIGISSISAVLTLKLHHHMVGMYILSINKTTDDVDDGDKEKRKTKKKTFQY